MSDEGDRGLTRRRALQAGLVGAAALAALPAAVGGAAEVQVTTKDDEKGSDKGARMPVAFVPHGGGPWPFVDMGLDRKEVHDLTTYLQELRGLPKAPPKALLVVSAHWEERVPTVMTAARPPMLYDYYGFPKASYEIQWPAPGEPRLARRVRSLLEEAGFETAEDDSRGFDHGTFVPFKLTWPDALVPTIQLSLVRGLDPAAHLAMGRALSSLRDDGVLILGSGMSYHNMRGFGDPRAREISETFDRWLKDATTAEREERDQLLSSWESAPAARLVHPREEHLLPLMVIAGAAGDDRAAVAFNGTMMGVRLSAYHFG